MEGLLSLKVYAHIWFPTVRTIDSVYCNYGTLGLCIRPQVRSICHGQPINHAITYVQYQSLYSTGAQRFAQLAKNSTVLAITRRLDPVCVSESSFLGQPSFKERKCVSAF